MMGADPSMASYNLYAYTGNNPVNRTDSGGQSWFGDILKGIYDGGREYLNNTGKSIGDFAWNVTNDPGKAVKTYASMMVSSLTNSWSNYSQIYNIGKNICSGNYYEAGKLYGPNAVQAATIWSGSRLYQSYQTYQINKAAKMWDKGTFSSGYDSMVYHHGKHGLPGQSMIQYTKDAYNFGINNSSVLQYTYNYNYGNATWNMPTGMGSGTSGYYNGSGQIITFWYGGK